jgi:hypothetical protein
MIRIGKIEDGEVVEPVVDGQSGSVGRRGVRRLEFRAGLQRQNGSIVGSVWH